MSRWRWELKTEQNKTETETAVFQTTEQKSNRNAKYWNRTPLLKAPTGSEEIISDRGLPFQSCLGGPGSGVSSPSGLQVEPGHPTILVKLWCEKDYGGTSNTIFLEFDCS